jgi:hypothetical protein
MMMKFEWFSYLTHRDIYRKMLNGATGALVKETIYSKNALEFV